MRGEPSGAVASRPTQPSLAVEVRRLLPYATGGRTSSTSLPNAGDGRALTAEIHEAGHHGAPPCRLHGAPPMRRSIQTSQRDLRRRTRAVAGLLGDDAGGVPFEERVWVARRGRRAGRCRLRQRAPPLSEPSRHLGERHEQRRGNVIGCGRPPVWLGGGMSVGCRRGPPRQLPAERVDLSCSTGMRRRRTSAAARASGQRVARRVAATSGPQMTAR
jgi:hypothetical protein